MKFRNPQCTLPGGGFSPPRQRTLRITIFYRFLDQIQRVHPYGNTQNQKIFAILNILCLGGDKTISGQLRIAKLDKKI